MKSAIRKIWKLLPPGVRLWLVRATQRKFTVSAAAVIFNDKCEVLLLDHVLRPYSGWGLPGGFIGHGEQPHDPIRREVMEEVGIDLVDIEIHRIRTIRRHVEILFTAKAIGNATVKSREIIELGWFTADNLPEQMSGPQKALVRRVLESEH